MRAGWLDTGFVRRQLDWVWPILLDDLATWAIFCRPGEWGERLPGYCSRFDRRTVRRRGAG